MHALVAWPVTMPDWTLSDAAGQGIVFVPGRRERRSPRRRLQRDPR
jgi:hypothetical protein